MGKLNKESSVPLYQQLVNEIKDQIREGMLHVNDRLMTEIELSKEYDISRITVRKAIEILVDEEILVKRQGIGTFVAEKKLNRDITMFMGFTQSCHLAGRKAGTKLLTADLVEATPTDMKNLELEEGERIIRIIRLRYCDDMPVIIEENHFSQKYAFLLGRDLNTSLHEILAESNGAPVNGTKSIGICHANEMEQKYLNVELNAALLLTKDMSYDKNGAPVYFSKSVINPERYTLSVVLKGEIAREDTYAI